MRKALLISLVLVGCRTVPVGMTSAASVGAGAPRGAVEQMLVAAQQQDLQAIAAVWGDERGLTRERLDRNELESRTFIMACVLRHETRKLGDPQPAANGRVFITAELKQGANTGEARFIAARTGAGRWLVSDVDLPALQNKGFCTRPG
ncbi:MAG: hypothetical protein FJ202_10735 [Gemmatimonadetes bacterium]|nr:hypothetical protein [Gemmatimonadota bacterium]